MSAVVVAELRRDVRGVQVLSGVSWSAHAGAITALLGPNGAGKTTTIECLTGLQRPTSGMARVLDADPWRSSPEHRARVGVMLQDGGLPVTTTPRRLFAHLARLYASPIDLTQLIPRLGLQGVMDRSIRRLSGGERQRVGVLAALIGSPDVVFLDEPTAGLDPHARLDLWDLMRECAATGMCLVLTTHSFEEAERLADHVAILDHGRVVAEGSLDQVRGAESLETRYFDLTRASRT